MLGKLVLQAEKAEGTCPALGMKSQPLRAEAYIPHSHLAHYLASVKPIIKSVSHNLCSWDNDLLTTRELGCVNYDRKALCKYTRPSKLHLYWLTQAPEQLLVHKEFQSLLPWAMPVPGCLSRQVFYLLHSWKELRRDCWAAAGNIWQSLGPLTW